MQIIWSSPTGWVTGEATLRIAHPSVAHSSTIVTCTEPGDFKWISMGLWLLPNTSIQRLTICYQISGPNPSIPPQSFVSQVRLVEIGTPEQATVLHDDPTDLHETSPTRHIVEVGGKTPGQGAAVQLSLRLNYQTVGDSIALGAVGVTFHPAFAPFSVRDFGAIGDGATHPLSARYSTLAEAQVDHPGAASLSDEIDGVAIQTALDAGGSSGRAVYVPAGVYRISSIIEVTAPVSLVGTGLDSVLQMVTTPPPATATGERCIIHVRSDFVSLSHLAFKGSGTNLVVMDPSGAHAHPTACQFAITADPQGSETARWGTVEGCSFLGDVAGASATAWLNNGIKLNNPTAGGDVVGHWRIADNTFEGLMLAADGAGYGVLLGTSNGNVVVGNRFYGSPGHGRHAVYLSGGASYNSVARNHVEGFNESAITMYAVALQPACKYNSIVDNFIADPAVTSGMSGAIDIEQRASFNVVRGNVIRAPGRHGISVLANGDTSDDVAAWTTIIGNVVSDSGSQGIVLHGASHTLVAQNTILDAGSTSNDEPPAIGIYHDGNVRALANTIAGNVIGGASPPSWRAGIYINGTNQLASPLTDTCIFGNAIQPGTGATKGQRFVALEGSADDYQRGDAAGSLQVAAFVLPAAPGGNFTTFDVPTPAATPGDGVMVAYRGGSLPAGVLVHGSVSVEHQVRVTFVNLTSVPQPIQAGALRTIVVAL